MKCDKCYRLAEFGMDGEETVLCADHYMELMEINHEEEVANRKFQLIINRQNEKFREEHPDF